MRTLLSGMALALAILVTTSVMPAQSPPPKPGPEHEKLKQMEGVWEATINTKEGDSKGTMTSKMTLGGLWLQDNFKADFGGMMMEGRGLTSYDPAKKKYVNVWFDSMSFSPMVSEGTFDKEAKRLVMTGESSHDGQTMKVKMTTEMKDANNMVFTMDTAGPDGKAMQLFKISYKRQAK